MITTSKKNNPLIASEDLVVEEGRVRVFRYPNMIVRVHFPDISDEENERRMQRIRIAATEVLKEARRKR